MTLRPRSLPAAAGIAVLLLSLLLAAAPVARAADPTPTPAPAKLGTSISLSGPTDVTIGGEVTLDARLTTSGGAPLAGLRLILGIRSVDSRTSRTGADGVASFSLPSEELSVAGTLPLSVLFDGDDTHLASSAATTIEVRPASIVVATVPAVPGLKMTLGEVEATTDASGVATFLVDRVGRVPLVPDLELPITGGIQVSFVRWEDDVFDAGRTVNVKGDERLVLGLRTAVRVRIEFVDPAGRAVDPAIVASVGLVAASGQERTVTAYDDLWLEAALPAKRTAGLTAVTNLHRVSEVIIAGTNVVNRGQQVWEPTPGGILTVELLLYQLQIRAVDALMRWPIETDVRLEFPDGSIRTGRTDAEGSVTFGDLPRGDYTVRLGASGIVPPSPIALSRPQEATIRVISTFDMSLAGGAALVVVLALVLLGRRHQVQRAAERARSLAGNAAGQAAVAAGHSDRTARALFDRLAARSSAILRGRRLTMPTPSPRPADPATPAGPPRPARQALPRLTRPRLPAFLGALRLLRAKISNAGRAGLSALRGLSAQRGLSAFRKLTDEARTRLMIAGAAIVGVGLLVALVAAVLGPPPAASGSASPSGSIVAATSGPPPTPARPSPGVAALRPIIEVNGYLSADRAALETALASSPGKTSDLVTLLRGISQHVRVASEVLERTEERPDDAAVLASMAGVYERLAADAAAALAVSISNGDAYRANAAAIAAVLGELEALTADLEALAAGTPAP